MRELRLALSTYFLQVVLSDQDDRTAILACLEAGAQGYILKSSSPGQFVRALETILTGGLFAPASLRRHADSILPGAATNRQELQRSPVLSCILTERQRHVFEPLAEGCATKTIAPPPGSSPSALVKVHLAAIYRTLGASSRLEKRSPKPDRAYAAVYNFWATASARSARVAPGTVRHAETDRRPARWIIRVARIPAGMGA